MSRAAHLAGVAALVSGHLLGCSTSTEEPPARTFEPLSAAPVGSTAAASALPDSSGAPTGRVVLPASSGAPVVVPPTVHGVLPGGFADSVCPEGAPVRVALLAPGATPRRALRYAFKLGSRKTTVMQMQPEISIDDADQPRSVNLPALELRVDLSVARHDAGEIRLAGKFLGVDLASGMPVDADPKPLQAALASVRRQGFEIDVDDRGRQRAFRATGEDPSDPGPTQLIEQMRQGLGALVVPLPDEEIGLGATWQSVARVKGRTELVQFTTWTLKSLTGDVFEVEGHAELFAVTDKLELPAGGGTAKIGSFSSSGDGATTTALDEVGPRAGRWNVRASVEVAASSGAVKMSSKILFEMGRGPKASP